MNNDLQKTEGKQLTVRGLIIGAIGSVVITMSSTFIALKLSSLPWPIIFVALVSMFSLKLMGNTSLNEINVTHTAMSAGAMVAGGLAFTIPGIWILMPDEKPDLLILMCISIGGTILGLIFTALIRKYFIEEKELEYPMGVAAAETVIAGDEGGSKAKLLFGTLGITAVFAAFRDWFKVIPASIMSKKMAVYGSAAGVWFSPMMIGMGYILGPVLIGIWFAGALLGDFGILFAGTKFGFFDTATALTIKQSLGIGLMVGTGIGILVKGIFPKIKEIFAASFKSTDENDIVLNAKSTSAIAVLLAVIFATVCDLGFAASIITILGAWLATSMSAECVGQTGVNPMEIFGILILLLAKAVTGIGEIEAFYVAAIVAVAAGLVGDVMNDFKAGQMMGTSPRAQWISEAVGGLVGAVTAVFTIYAIYTAYGSGAIGGSDFPAAQAAAVASMVGGISNMPAFVIGAIAAVILYLAGFPVMTLGLGVYLPFYLSATAFIGGAIRFITDRIVPEDKADGKGVIIASGCLGGEAVVGVVISIILAVSAL